MRRMSKPGTFDENNIVEHTVIAAVSCGLGVMLVFYWWNRDWLLEPEVHRGVWHTCDDPKLKGKWHWSCCDSLEKDGHCRTWQPLVEMKQRLGLLPDLTRKKKSWEEKITFGKAKKR